jgi:hypothetical protein
MNNNPIGWSGTQNPVFTSYREFTQSGLWTNPRQGTFFYIEAIGGGGGGGSGDRGAAGTLRSAGASAHGAACVLRFGLLSALNSIEIVTIGSGATGATGITTDDTVGGAATTGGATSFGSIVYALGGGPIPPVRGNTTFIRGYAGIAGANIGGICLYGPGGSGTGGSITAANIANSGSSGGQGFAARKSVGRSSFGFGGNTNGGNGLTVGDSGGGGLASNTATGGNGGNGAFPGGSGGGGGATLNGFTSGAGGNGANGFLRIWTW